MKDLQQPSEPNKEIKKKCSFSRFYSKDQENMNALSINQLLTIPSESINSYAMVCLCSTVIVPIANKLNSGQQLVTFADPQFCLLGK